MAYGCPVEGYHAPRERFQYFGAGALTPGLKEKLPNEPFSKVWINGKYYNVNDMPPQIETRRVI